MTYEKLRGISPKYIRSKINEAVELSEDIHKVEDKLVRVLFEIDSAQFYIRVGFKSLTGFCVHALNLTETQTQRVVTRVRRYEPIPNIGKRQEETQLNDRKNGLDLFKTKN